MMWFWLPHCQAIVSTTELSHNTKRLVEGETNTQRQPVVEYNPADIYAVKPVTSKSSPAIEETVHYRIAVLSSHGELHSQQRWQPLMDYLTDIFPHLSFEVVALNFTMMEKQLLSGEVQFIVTNPGHYLSLSEVFPISWLATMRSLQHDGSPFSIGSTIVVRSDSHISTLHELQNKTMVASDPKALGGYQAALGLIHSMGYQSNSFFAKETFLGFPLEPILYQIRDGTADVAITPFCTLERMVKAGNLQRDDFRVIHDMTPPGYDCAVSTPLYPNWSFAASDSVPLEIKTQITQALLALDENHPVAVIGENRGWAAPISQFHVINMFKQLNLTTNKISFIDQLIQWIERYKQWALACIGLILLSLIYHLWLEFKFRQKSDNLIHAERQLKDKAVQLERLQNAAILGEIGAGLAHELNQPIASITQYSEGGMMSQAKASGEDSAQYLLLQKINQQSIRAAEVVHRIRALLQRKQSEQTAFDVKQQIIHCLELLQHELTQHNVSVHAALIGGIEIKGDQVGFNQVIINVLKNALDSMLEKQYSTDEIKQIQIMLSQNEKDVHITIFDNGIGLITDENELKSTFFSTKPDGLGLGLGICKEVISQMNGQFTLSNCRSVQHAPWTAGCCVDILLRRHS